MMKEIEDTNKWKDIPCSWIGRINVIKMAILPNTIYRLNAISIKISMTFFYSTRTNSLNIYMEPQKTQNCQRNSEKKEQTWRYNAPRLQYYKATVIKKAWYWHKNRHMDQWNRIESPEINPVRYEDSLLNKWCWENWISICKRMKLNPYQTPYAKIK